MTGIKFSSQPFTFEHQTVYSSKPLTTCRYKSPQNQHS